eukprot:167580-Amphidinium_carterae.1
MYSHHAILPVFISGLALITAPVGVTADNAASIGCRRPGRAFQEGVSVPECSRPDDEVRDPSQRAPEIVLLASFMLLRVSV